MKHLTLLGAAVWMSLLAGCQQNELTGKMDESLDVRLQASVAGTDASSRTLLEENGKTVFAEGDEIGLFMPQEDTSVKWSLSTSLWTSDSKPVWKNKVDNFEFCAYYPYVDGDSRTQIPMPDLTTQTGEASLIGDYDFLAARCSASYTDNNGTVSFTKDAAFKHVFSLISVTVQKNGNDESMTLNQISFEGKDIVSRHTYKFGEMAEEDALVPVAESEGSSLILTPETAVEEQGHTTMVVINPGTLASPLKFSIAYVCDGHSYTASTTQMGQNFEAGKYYRYTVRLNKEELLLSGNEVADWNQEDLSDLVVTEEPAE